MMDGLAIIRVGVEEDGVEEVVEQVGDSEQGCGLCRDHILVVVAIVVAVVVGTAAEIAVAGITTGTTAAVVVATVTSTTTVAVFAPTGLPKFTHFCLGTVDTRSKQVDTSPKFQKTQLPDWDSRSISISRSYKPSFQEEVQGNQGESLERRLLYKAREQIQLKRLRRRRISSISDVIKAEHCQLRRIFIDFHQASSIEVSARPLHRRTLFLHPFPSSQSLFFLISSVIFVHEVLHKFSVYESVLNQIIARGSDLFCV
ncbi:hypothetical protein Taro_018415 [Colocasia esculenta]|uniref:Uncharacterized protein n=1 Tax=Colocasia esculenta TaxID=4460 RepID=A0A843UQM4_COLES|nr:hypothetical protein [Colocasia esculenta]